MREFRFYGERPQWDASLVVKVEELIDIAVGEQGKNVVDFKMLQTVLYILARHLRILEQTVEVRTHGGEQHEDISSKEDIGQKAKSKERVTKSRKKGSTSSDGYLSGDESEESDDVGRGKTESTVPKEQISEKKIRREGSKDRDDEREERYGGSRGKSTKSYEKDESGLSDKDERRKKAKARDDENLKSERAETEKDRDKKKEREVERFSSEDREVGGKRGQPGGHHVGSIEVVTQQQFEQLERVVRELQARAAVPATPRMPDNKKLISDITQGSASLPDVMEAMQLHARIQAAERAIERMAQLVSLLAASGELPAEVLSTFTELEADVASMAATMDKVQATTATKSPREHVKRKSLGLETLGTLSTLTTDEAEATAAMKRGIMGASGRAAAEGREAEGEVIAGKEGKKGKKIGQATEKGKPKVQTEKGQTQLEQAQEMEEAEEGRIFFVKTHDENVLERDRRESRPSAAGAASERERESTSTRRSLHSRRSISSCVTIQEMNDALRALREDFLKNIGNITARANASAETAVRIAKEVGSKLARAMELNDRVSILYTTVNDYTEQLRGFDDGIHSQIQSFQQQLNSIKQDLGGGLHELHHITNNAETAAVVELKEQYDLVTEELDNTLHSHRQLLNNEQFLTSEIKNLAECIEELRDQKADKDEVVDGLRDKADISRLEGLLSMEDFNKLYEDLLLRMDMCYDKFRAQESVWLTVVKEFKEVILSKAETSHMMALQEKSQEQLEQLHQKAVMLKRVLGDPKAAVLTRKLSKSAMCAACAQGALVDVSDAGGPPRLPALRPRPPGADDVCLRDDGLPQLTPYEDEKHRTHICNRWCGGSHTLLSSAVTRESAHFTAGDTANTRRYMGLGTDNKLYMMADPCQPCEECNVTEKIPGETEETSPHPGAGDQGDGPTVVTGLEARRVTVVADADIQLMRDELARKRRGVERRRNSDGGRRHSRRYSLQGMESPAGYEGVVLRKSTDIVVKRQITVLGDDDALHRTSVRHDRLPLKNLAPEIIREQFDVPLPNAPENDLITKAIAALSEL